MGISRTRPPDRRLIYVGGEYEDFDDPDFCIYNEVIVFQRNGDIEIFGYPTEVFPPTDFHSTTPTGGKILIVGYLGCMHERVPGFTQLTRIRLTPISR